MPARRSPLAGLLLTALVFAALWFLWFRAGSWTPPDAGSGLPAASREAAPRVHGGAIVAAIRSEPRTFNRLADQSYNAELLSLLTQGRLVRIDRATLDLEPWLAERWESSPDGRVHTFHLRRDVRWSDGEPFTADDVLFTLEAVYDTRVGSSLADSLRIGGRPIAAEAPEPHTVVITFPGPSGIGARLLDNLPIYPKHRLERALRDGTLADAWKVATTPGEIVGTGPFVFRQYEPGRLVFERNPNYWRRAADGSPLPYLDRLTLEVVPDPSAQILRLRAGEIDLVHETIEVAHLRMAREAEREGRAVVLEVGVAPVPDAFFFCLSPDAKARDPRFRFVRHVNFRRALSHAVDREAFAETVFAGEAVPVWGPIAPGNRVWFSSRVPRYPYDPQRARALLDEIGLRDRDGNGVVEDERGVEARFTLLSLSASDWAERGTDAIRESAKAIGVAFDVALLEPRAVYPRIERCDFDAAYARVLATDLDPAASMDLWSSSGRSRFWVAGRTSPPEPWELEIDGLMAEQAASPDPARRRALFEEVQRIFAEQLPALYFAAPRLYTAHSTHLTGVTPSVLPVTVLWSADTLSVTR